MIWPIVAVFQVWMAFWDLIFLILASAFYSFLSVFRMIFPGEMKSLEGDIVLVTGAGQGIGKELSLQFARYGTTVVCLDENEKRNNKTVIEIRNEGGEAVGFVCDVTHREDVSEVSKRIRKLIGDVTILVTAYDVVPYKPFLEYTPSEIEMIFDSNVFSHFWPIKAWLPTFIKRGSGHIVSISSLCGTIGVPNLVPYSSSKHAVTGLLEGLTEELRYGNLNPNIKLTRIHAMPELINFGGGQNGSIPLMNTLTSIEDYANCVVESVRREEEVVFVPNHYYHITKLSLVLPKEIRRAVYDFVDKVVRKF